MQINKRFEPVSAWRNSHGLQWPMILLGLGLLLGHWLLPVTAAAQTLRDLERVIIDQNTIIEEYTPPPQRGTVRLTLTDLKAQPHSEEEMAQTFELRRVTVDEVTLVSRSEVERVWNDRLSSEITLKELFSIANEIEQVYRDAGYLVIAAVPDQDFTSGDIRIVMFEESFISTVKFESTQLSLEPRLKPYIDQIVNMQPLKILEVERVLLLMSDLAGLSVLANLTRPEVPGEGGTLSLEIEKDQSAISVGLDNSGISEVGPLQLSGRMVVNDMFNQFETSTLTGVTTPVDPQELFYLQVAQNYPIGSNGYSAGYNIGQIWSEPGGELESLDVQVDSFFAGFNATYALVRTVDRSVFATVEFNMKNDDVDILGQRASRGQTRWLSLSLDSTHNTSLANVEWSVAFLQGLNVLDATRADAPDSSRPGADADFSAVQGSAAFIFGLTDRLSLTSRFIGQYGFERLPAAVLFSFGGVPYGRAFDSAVISGDSGIATVNELSLGNVIQHKSIRGSSAFAFIDYGATWDHNSDFENSDESLGSTGVGLRLRFSTGISAEATVSVPIKSISDIADPGVTGFFSLGMSF